ncbi:MAG: integrin alpha, partial [Ignavibacteria bacterium]
MKKNIYFIRILLMLFSFIFVTESITAQQLVQSFIEINTTGDTNFGYSVSGAGDVNNDGYDDVIVGFRESEGGSDAGRAYIYYGGSPMNAEADVTMKSEGTGSNFGYSVSGAGDVNNDGYADVIVGAGSYNSQTGRVYIYYGGSSMDAEADVTIDGEEASTNFGHSVSGAGDVNGDNIDDVIVGAYTYNSYTGRAYIYYGGSSMDADADVTMTGEGTLNYYGYLVSGAGDVNGDNIDDVIVGAVRYNDYTGRAYIYYGGSPMNATADVTMTGENEDDYFGCSVSGVGDVNSDDIDDVIVGAPDYNDYTGRAYIYYGGSSMDATVDVTMDGEAQYDRFGSSVSGAGDVNSDDIDDVIVGAPEYNNYVGRAYIYYGGSSMDTETDVTMDGEGTLNYFGYSVSGAGDVNGDNYDDIIVGTYKYNSCTGRVYIYYGGSSMDAEADVTMTGENEDDYFGWSVSGAGDVNGDNIDDVIVGAYRYNTYRGRAYIYYGGSSMDSDADVTMTGEGTSNYLGMSVSGAGDVNNDGYADVIVGATGCSTYKGCAYIYYGGSSMDANADVTMEGEAQYNRFGTSVSCAGDVNGDNIDDVIVGAYQYNTYRGRVYIYYGAESMSTTPTADVTMTGEGTYNYFGYSVSGAGDVNNDGNADVIVGAYGYSSSRGRAYIYYGGSSMDAETDVTMTGEGTYNYFGYSVSGTGDVNGDNYDDIIVGAYRYDNDRGRAYIYHGGSTMDTDADITMDGENANDYFGCSVSGAGDVNGDGYVDVVIGAYSYPLNGKVYIYYTPVSLTSAPTAQPTDLVFSINSSDQILLNYTASADAESYLIVRGTGSAPTFTPSDGTEYSTGTQGSDYIVYVGTEVTAADNTVSTDGHYYYSIYAYNGSGTSTKYLTTNPLSGNTVYDTDGENVNLSDTGSDPVTATFPGQDVTVNFPNGCNGTTLTVSKNTSVPASNFAALPGVKGTKPLFFTITSTNANPGTYTIILDFSSLGLSEDDWSNFQIMKRENSSNKFQNITDLGGTIVSRQTDGVWGKFTITGLSSFSEFAGGEAATTYTVTSTAETGEGTLKQHITDAEAGDIIEFNPASMGDNTITLSSAISISKNLTIRGASGGIIIDGNATCRIFEVNDGVTLRLENLKIENGSGSDGYGGAIYNQGSLTMINCVVSGNNDDFGSTGAGAIYQDNDSGNELNLVNCTITNNSCTDYNSTGTGGIVADAGSVNIYNTIIYGNTGDGYSDIKETNTITELQNSCIGNLSSLTITTDGGDNISSDPSFVTVSGSSEHPYSISGSSPCLDVGDDSYSFETEDIKGSGRKLLKTDGTTTGTIDIGAYEYDSESPLPVELTSFTASVIDNTVALRWKTATEVNNYGFEIQRQVSSVEYQDGEWQKIGFVNGNGNSSSPKSYSYTDTPTGGTTFIY